MFFVSLVAASVSFAQGANVVGLGGDIAAIGADGHRYRSDTTSSSYTSQKTPWMKDAIKMIGPEYPFSARAARSEGAGIFSLTLNPRTGYVADVSLKKSTGFKALDESATVALRQWRWKPGKWKQIEIPVTFSLSSPAYRKPAGSIPLPHAGQR